MKVKSTTKLLDKTDIIGMVHRLTHEIVEKTKTLMILSLSEFYRVENLLLIELKIKLER